MTFAPNVVVGLGLAMVGVAMLLDRAGVIAAREILTFWPVLLILFGAAVCWQAVRGVDVNGKRPRPIVGPGMVLMLVMASILGSEAWERRDRFERRTSTEDSPSLLAVMGQSHGVSHSTSFQGGDMTSVMGGSRLDLREAKMAPGQEATIDVFGVMGEVEILVPEDWVVDVRATPVMGGVRDSRPFSRSNRGFLAMDQDDAGDGGDDPAANAPSAEAPVKETATPVEAPAEGGRAPRLVVRGFIMMGALKIRS